MKRNGTIDFFKFIFTLIIIIYHSFSFVSRKTAYFKGGYVFVAYFFIVSGLLMAKSLCKQNENEKLLGGGYNIWKVYFK